MRKKGRFASLVVLVLAFALGLFLLSQSLKSPARLLDPLVAQIEERLGAAFSFQSAKIVFTPFLLLQVEKPRLESMTEGLANVSAEQAQFSFQLLPFLWGQVRLSGFQLREAEGTFWGVPLEHLEFKVKGLGGRSLAPFEWKGNVAGGKESLQGKGGIAFQNSSGPFWTGVGLKADVTLKDVSLTERAGRVLKRFPEGQLSGDLEGGLHIEKEKGANVVKALAEFEVKNFKSGSSEAVSLPGRAELLWNLQNGSIELKEVLTQSPFGAFEGSGIFRIETGEIEEARLMGRKVVLEELARHFPSFHSVLPLDTGFSGESEFDLTLRGTWDYLSIHANWNLTPATVAYGKIFSKPKDFPMGINFDFLLKGGSLLSGDFSLRIRQTTIKGALVNLNVSTGAGEMTLLTNKFDLAGWETLLAPFDSYQLSGSAKILLNCKGNLAQLPQTQKMLNLTLEDVTLLSPAGRGIQHTHALIDAGSLGLRIKDSRFEVGGSSVAVEGEIYNLKENPQGTVQVTSPSLDPFAFLENLRVFVHLLFSEKAAVWTKIEEGVHRFLPKPIAFEAFTLTLKTESPQWTLENLEFQALGGKFHFRAGWEKVSDKTPFWIETDWDRGSLAKYFAGHPALLPYDERNPAENIFDGNVFFKGRFQGRGITSEDISKSLSGKGALAITNGEWYGLDLLGPVARLPSFGSLSPQAAPSTPFTDLKAGWSYGEGKFDTHDFLLHSKNLWVEGKGNLLLDGTLNGRLDITLSTFLTAQVMKSWEGRDRSEGKQLGPIPFLLVGSLTQPQPRQDDGLIGSFLEAVRERRFRRILREPFKEVKE